MLEKIDSYCWQNYLDWPEIENWSDDSHRIVLTGEASHPLIVSPLPLPVIYALTMALYSLAVHRAVAYP
jgi:hypothetical protein